MTAHPAVVVVNPRAAGGSARRHAQRLRNHLNRRGPSIRFEVPESPDAARGLLRELPQGSRVVLVGGDGTVHTVLPELLERQHVLGLVPLGSGNDFARAIGSPLRDPFSALDLALDTPARCVDVGSLEVGSHQITFSSSVAAGFDSAVGLRALRGPTWLTGLPRYLWATLGALSSLEHHVMEVSLDGEPWLAGEQLFASVLNTASYGSGMQASPAARVDDGVLNAVVAGGFGRLGTLAMLPRLLVGRHVGHPKIGMREFVEMRVRADRPVPIAADGEPVGGFREWSIRVQPRRLRVAISHQLLRDAE